MARVALALVPLGHEGDRHALLRGDLLGAVLVDHVLVGRAQRGAVAEVDLVLAEVALALRVLDRHARAHHRVADAADQRLDARGAEHRVVDVVEVGRLEIAVALAPRVLVGVVEDDELELGAGLRAPAALGQPVELARAGSGAARRPRRCRPPTQVRHQERGARVPRDRAQRVEVRLHLEVAVAARPRRHRVAVDGVHVHVDGQQVVAALGAVLGDVVEEVAAVSRLPWSRPSMSAIDEQHGVHRAVVDRLAQLVERHTGEVTDRRAAVPGRELRIDVFVDPVGRLAVCPELVLGAELPPDPDGR